MDLFWTLKFFSFKFLTVSVELPMVFALQKQMFNPKHVPTCHQGHFSVKSSIYNQFFNASNTEKQYRAVQMNWKK